MQAIRGDSLLVSHQLTPLPSATMEHLLAHRLANLDSSISVSPSSATEQELHVLRRELLHRRLIVIDSAVDHIRLLLL